MWRAISGYFAGLICGWAGIALANGHSLLGTGAACCAAVILYNALRPSQGKEGGE